MALLCLEGGEGARKNGRIKRIVKEEEEEREKKKVLFGWPFAHFTPPVGHPLENIDRQRCPAPSIATTYYICY